MDTPEAYTLNMLALLIAAAYTFPVNHTDNYELKVNFDGYVPVLGGIDGKVDVNLKMAVTGLEPKGDHPVRVSSDLTEAIIKIDDEKLPFNAENLKQFFPKNTISATALGEIKENDAPNLNLPVKLPGLDVKRIPEISYMPVQFPAAMEEGKSFIYKKPFGESEVEYEMTPKMDGNILRLTVKMKQSYGFMEDESFNKVDAKTDAKFEIATNVTGTGTIDFDTSKGRLISSKIVADAASVVTEIKTTKKTNRKLRTTVECRRI